MTVTPAVLGQAPDKDASQPLSPDAPPSPAAPPFAPQYGDVYHPPSGAWTQARHVFLSGNGLPARWQGRDRFVILETGFGLGNNFLATWAAWQADAQRCDRLVFISIEKHPLVLSDLRRVHGLDEAGGGDVDVNADANADADADPDAPIRRELAGRLCAAWPALAPGWHLLDLDARVGEDGRHQHVRLMLGLGDIADLLPSLQVRVDAFYLDGFAPARNPEMWSPQLISRLDRLAQTDATAATWSAARVVRDALAQAQFEVRKVPGQGGKWATTVARYAPRFVPPPPPGGLHPQVPPSQRHALVIGAGLAGCSAAWSLTRQGWRVTLLDAEHGPAMAASGNPGGLFHSIVHADDGVHARTHRAAALATWARVRHWVADGLLDGQCNGLLRLDPKATEAERATLLSRQPWLTECAQWLTQAEAQARSGLAVPSGGWLFTQAGWLHPAGYARRMLDEAAMHRAPGASPKAPGQPLLRTRWQAAVHTLRRVPAGHAASAGEQAGDDALEANGWLWQACDAQGQVLAEAPTVVLANAQAASVLLAALPPDQAVAPLPLSAVRGQITLCRADATPEAESGAWPRPHLPVAGNGYALTLRDGSLLCGATSQHHDDAPEVREADHRHNLRQAARLGVHGALGPIPSGTAVHAHADTTHTPLPAGLQGRVGWRATTPDRLPLVGALPWHADRLNASGHARREQVRMLPRQRDAWGGLYALTGLGSRGITWAALAGELLAHWVTGMPCPVEAELRDALDPARFLARQHRHSPSHAPHEPQD